MRIIARYSAAIALAAAVMAGCSNGSAPSLLPSSGATSFHGSAGTSAARLLAMSALAKIAVSQHAKPGAASTAPMYSSNCQPGTAWWPWCQWTIPCCMPCFWCKIGGPVTPLNPLVTLSDLLNDEIDYYNTTESTLADSGEPYGECVDAKGDTWIANFGGDAVVEYARGGTEIASLNTDGYTIGCAVSRKGDLAVANMATSSGYGNIQVFKRAAGTPSAYSNGNDYYFWPPGYDDKGNLFVEAETSSGVGVAELPAKGSSLEPVSVNQTIYYPGSVMWDGKYITLTDQDAGGNPSSPATTIYQTSETGSGLTVVGSTSLQDSCDGSQVDVVQPFIVGAKNTPLNKGQGGVVIGGNLSCENRVDVWSYPAGGEPIASASPVPAYAYGQAVSVSLGKK